MKKLLLTSLGAMLTISITAQVPQGISHQAVIRDAENQLVTDLPVGIKVSIFKCDPGNPAVYSEIHVPVSNANGLITFVIGQGVSNVDFYEIDWTDGPFFLKTEADPSGGTNYTITGTSQFLSVPYAFHAQTMAQEISVIGISLPCLN